MVRGQHYVAHGVVSKDGELIRWTQNTVFFLTKYSFQRIYLSNHLR